MRGFGLSIAAAALACALGASAALACALGASANAATAPPLTVSAVRALFAGQGIELVPGTERQVVARLEIPASLPRDVVVLVPAKGHARGLSDLIVLVWVHPSKAQQASATWVNTIHPHQGWLGVDYNVVWSSTRQSEVASPILRAITSKVIVGQCRKAGGTAAACSSLAA
jgi:hypothetical protein